jgi:glycosyltransferase involved in cell wall biosynthesis
MARTPLTALIHTLNEVDQIEDCLRSVAWADEIYLLDSFSTDGTVELVRERFPRVRVEQRKSFGSAAQKNYGMDRASHDWILGVDADERVTEPLRREIESALQGSTPPWAYSIGRRNFVLGKEIHYSGLQRDRVTRLFHRAHARYPNRRVHAELEVDGPAGRLEGKFLHYYVRSLDHMIEKMTRYGVWGGSQLFLDGKHATPATILGHAAGRFFRDYFINLGILDGARGLITVGMHTYYTFWKYTKLWELNEQKRAGKTVELPDADVTRDRWVKPWEEAS